MPRSSTTIPRPSTMGNTRVAGMPNANSDHTWRSGYPRATRDSFACSSARRASARSNVCHCPSLGRKIERTSENVRISLTVEDHLGLWLTVDANLCEQVLTFLIASGDDVHWFSPRRWNRRHVGVMESHERVLETKGGRAGTMRRPRLNNEGAARRPRRRCPSTQNSGTNASC